MTRPTKVPAVNDDRLCWLAVRDQIDRKARKLGLFGWLTVTGSGGRSGAALGGGLRNERRADSLADYAFAVDALANTLSTEERTHLHATGEVPAWFLPEVERQAAEIKKSR